jgi:hypothetical protein
MNILEGLTNLVGGKRSRKHRRQRKSRRSRRGGNVSPNSPKFGSNAAPVGGKKSRRKSHKKSRNHKKGGSQLVPLGFLAALLATKSKRHSKKRRSRKH